VKQQDADGLSSHSGYQSPLHRFFHYQPNGPAGATLRRVTADHRDNPLFLAIVQHFSRSGPRLLVEGAFEAAFLVTVRHIANCLRSQGNHAEIRGALTPLASWERAKARSTTRTCCTPPLNNSRNSFRSLEGTLMRRAFRAIPDYAPKHFIMELFYCKIFKRS